MLRMYMRQFKSLRFSLRIYLDLKYQKISPNCYNHNEHFAHIYSPIKLTEFITSSENVVCGILNFLLPFLKNK